MRLVRAELPTDKAKSVVLHTLEQFIKSGYTTMRLEPEQNDGNFNWTRRFAATACKHKMPVKVVRAGGEIYLVRVGDSQC